jgi:serine/threonine protein kinase
VAIPEELSPGTCIRGDSGAAWTTEGVIGRGGTAIVYAVRDADGRAGAAKILSDHRYPVTPAMRKRFAREIAHLSSLDHRNILRVLDRARHGDDDVLISVRMSGSLYDKLAGCAPASVNDVLTWLRQALSGLEEMHRVGMIHRDLSAKNLLFSPDGALVVADFGTVRHLDDMTITGPADHLGSLLYISPQQFRDSHTAQPTDDIYSLGQVGWQAVVGLPPQGNVPPAGVLRGEIPYRLSELIEQMRAFDPDHRPTASAALDSVAHLAETYASAFLSGPAHAADSGPAPGEVTLPFEPNGDGSLAPMLPIELHDASGNAFSARGLVDTGADRTALPIDFMGMLGIVESDCIVREFVGGGGTSRAFTPQKPIPIRVLDKAFELTPLFIEVPFPLLGREDVLAQFSISIDQRSMIIRLRPLDAPT